MIRACFQDRSLQVSITQWICKIWSQDERVTLIRMQFERPHNRIREAISDP